MLNLLTLLVFKICSQEKIIAKLIKSDPMNLIVRDSLSVINTVKLFKERQILYIKINAVVKKYRFIY